MFRLLQSLAHPSVILVLLGATGLILGAALLADAARWVARARRVPAPDWTSLFRGWPLVLWGAAAALLPELPWRIAAGAAFALHALTLAAGRAPRGQVVAARDA